MRGKRLITILAKRMGSVSRNTAHTPFVKLVEVVEIVVSLVLFVNWSSTTATTRCDNVLTEGVSAHSFTVISCRPSLRADHEVLGSYELPFPRLEAPAVVGQLELTTSIDLDPGLLLYL